MFKNLDSDNDTEDGHTHSGRVFRGVHLENLFMQKYKEEGLYSGEEADLMNEEHSEPTKIEEVRAEELRRGEHETSKTIQTIELSIINPPVISAALGNQNNQNHRSLQSIVTSSSASTEIGNLGISMVDEMRLPIFRGDGSEDFDQHWFLCESIWNIKNVTNEAVKRTQFCTTLRDHALRWYMKLV
jgi:hypothetical protein